MLLLKWRTRDKIERDNITFIYFHRFRGVLHFFFSWEEQVLQTPEEAAAPADSSGAAVASTATSANSAGMQEEQQKEPDPTSPEHAQQEEKEELEEVWFD